MEEFKLRVRQYIDREIDESELERALWKVLQGSPERSSSLRDSLITLAKQGILSEDVSDHLLGVIDAFEQPAPAVRRGQRVFGGAQEQEVLSFPEQLKAFSAGEVDYPQLEVALLSEIQRHPRRLDRYIKGLQDLVANQSLATEVGEALIESAEQFGIEADSKTVVRSNPRRPARGQPDRAPEPEQQSEPGYDDDEDKTVVDVGAGRRTSTPPVHDFPDEDDDRTVVESRRKNVTHDDTTVVDTGPLSVDVDDDEEDKTVVEPIRRRAPPPASFDDDEDKTVVEPLAPRPAPRPASRPATTPAKAAPATSITESVVADVPDVPGADDATVIDSTSRFVEAPAAADLSEDSKYAEPDDATEVDVSRSVSPEVREITSATSSTKTSITSPTGSGNSKWAKSFDDEEGPPVGVGTIIKDRYKLVSFVGAGGMGDVYKAEDLVLVEQNYPDPMVAIKLLGRQFRDHPSALKSLQMEAANMQQLSHDNITRVFNFDRDEYNAFMAMELMEGEDLSKLIKKNPKGLALDEAKRFICEMADGLGYAHRAGMVHSDFKPGNVFVSRNVAKVFDFGIAQAASDGGNEMLAQDTFDAGDIGAMTPSYASPEMLEGSRDPDKRDDVYALGCMAYELLTGKHPFLDDRGKKVPGDKAKEQGLVPPDIETLKPWQQKVLKDAVAFDRDKRLGDLSHFLREFQTEKKAISPVLLGTGAAGVLAVVGLAVWVPGYLKDQDVQAFAELTTNCESAYGSSSSSAICDIDQLNLRINEIDGLELEQRNLYFRDPRVEDSLAGYFKNNIETLKKKDDYELALPILEQAMNIYDKYSDIVDLNKQFPIDRANRLAELDKALNGDVEQTGLLKSPDFATEYEQLKDIFESILKVDKSALTLATSQSVAIKIDDTARGMVAEGRLEEASKLTTFGLALLENDTRIARQVASISTLSQSIATRVNRERQSSKIAELENQLQNFDAASDLNSLETAIPAFSQLQEVAPDSEKLGEVRGYIEAQVDAGLDQNIASRNYADARTLIGKFAGVLTLTVQDELLQRVNQSESALSSQSDELFQAISRESRTASPDAALPYIEELKALTSDQQAIDDANNLVAQGWLRQARAKSDSQDWDGATVNVSKGLAVAVSDTLKSSLNQYAKEIESLRNLAGTQAEAQLAEQREKARLQRITDIEEEYRLAIEGLSFTTRDTRQVLNLIAELETADPENLLIAGGRSELVGRYVAEVDRLAADGKLDDAASLAQSGINLLPDSGLLSTSLTSVQSQLADQKRLQSQQQVDSVKGEISTLMAAFDPVRDGDRLLRQVQRYESLASSDVYSQDIRFQAADANVKRSEQLLESNRFDDALDSLGNARRFDSGHGRLAALTQQIQSAEVRYLEEQQQVRQGARIASLRQSFITQIQAFDADSAEATLGELATLPLSSDDQLFVASTVPQEFERAFLGLSARQARPETVQDAISLVQRGLGYKPDSQSLQRRLAIYQEAAKILTTIDLDKRLARVMQAEALKKYPAESLIASIVIPADEVVTTGTTITTPVPTKVPVVVAPGERYPGYKDCSPDFVRRGLRSSGGCWDTTAPDKKGPRLVVVENSAGEPMVIMKYELRVADYNDYCVATQSCSAGAKDGNLPMTGLTVDQIDSYVSWLNGVTQQNYTLPGLADWKAAANAGGAIQQDRNCVSFGGRGLQMQPINWLKSAGQNAWGLSHAIGNAQELVREGDSYQVAGGAYSDPNQDCSVELAKVVEEVADELTTIRLIRNM